MADCRNDVLGEVTIGAFFDPTSAKGYWIEREMASHVAIPPIGLTLKTFSSDQMTFFQLKLRCRLAKSKRILLFLRDSRVSGELEQSACHLSSEDFAQKKLRVLVASVRIKAQGIAFS
jgi:hypothetical protein